MSVISELRISAAGLMSIWSAFGRQRAGAGYTSPDSLHYKEIRPAERSGWARRAESSRTSRAGATPQKYNVISREVAESPRHPPIALPAPCRRQRRLRRANETSPPAEPANQVDVFHDLRLRVAAHRLEHIAAHEDRLITVRQTSSDTRRCTPYSINLAIGDAESSANLKQPATTRASVLAAAIVAVQPAGRRVSACRNNSQSPRANAAPAFICTARPRGASTQMTSVRDRRSVVRDSSSRVAATISSAPEKSVDASVRSSASASR